MKRFFLIIVIVLIIGGAYYLGTQNRGKSPQKETEAIIANSTNTPKPSPSTQPDEFKDWKSYSSDILFFKYPADFTLEERQKNFIVLLTDANNPQSVFASVDARFSDNYASYEKVIASAEAGLTDVQTQKLPGGIKISGKIGPGFAQGQPITISLFKYGDAAIEFETPATDPTQLELFDKILSTFALPD